MDYDLAEAARHLQAAAEYLAVAAGRYVPLPPAGNTHARKVIAEGLIAVDTAIGSVAWLTGQLSQLGPVDGQHAG